jgi:hypothetical protein
MASTDTSIVIRIPDGGELLPDNSQWTNRFTVRSSSSDREHIVAQHKVKRHWGCSCSGWRRHRNCHHLRELGLPSYEKPYEAKLTSGGK